MVLAPHVCLGCAWGPRCALRQRGWPPLVRKSMEGALASPCMGCAQDHRLSCLVSDSAKAIPFRGLPGRGHHHWLALRTPHGFEGRQPREIACISIGKDLPWLQAVAGRVKRRRSTWGLTGETQGPCQARMCLEPLRQVLEAYREAEQATPRECVRGIRTYGSGGHREVTNCAIGQPVDQIDGVGDCRRTDLPGPGTGLLRSLPNGHSRPGPLPGLCSTPKHQPSRLRAIPSGSRRSPRLANGGG
jgi:hypothetical protein